VRLAEAAEHAGPAPGVVTVTGRGRSATEMAAQLLDVLADDPRVVECDLAGMTGEGTAIADAFRPVNAYLTRWPGPVVMVHAPDASLRAGLRSVASADQLLVHASRGAATERHHVLPHLHRHRMGLVPVSTAPRQARTFVTDILADWQVPHMVGPTTQVVSELVTSALTAQASTVELMLSKVDERVRICVRDDGPSPAVSLDGVPVSPLNGAGLHLVQAFAQGWGVVPAPGYGKSVWAVLDSAGARADEAASPTHTSSRGWRRNVRPGGPEQARIHRRLGRSLRHVVPMRTRPARTDATSHRIHPFTTAGSSGSRARQGTLLDGGPGAS
jgi:hypothetical protein